MIKLKKSLLAIVGLSALALVLSACEAQIVEVEVTRVVTETVVEEVMVEGEVVEVEKEVEVVVTATPEPAMEEEAASKDLIICMAQEPETLYVYGGGTLVASAIRHAVFENDITTLSYDFQAQGLVKLPSLSDGDAVINTVDVTEGDMVLVGGEPKALEVGDEVATADGETVTYEGGTISMEQMVVDFEMKPRVWSDGTPVSASDSVYSYSLAADPDTQSSKFNIDRTASYEATGDLTVQRTMIPGFLDSEYHIGFWGPLPEHAWGGFTAAELIEAEESSRMPMGDGPFVIEEWVPGERITMVKNENYYRASEGYPKVDTVTYRFIPDTNSLVLQLLSGECDIGTQDGMDVAQSPFLLEAEAQGQLTPYFQTGTVFEHIDFGINSYGDYGDGIGRPDWFEDVRVRQAMTMCTDRQSMVDNILYGRSEVIHTFIPSVHPLYPEGLTEWPFDVDAGNALLDEVGYVDSDGDGIREDSITGVPFAITLGTTTGNEMRQQLTQIFKDNMIECGIDVELYYQPAGEWFADGPDGVLFGRRFDLGEFAWLTGVNPACDLYISENITGPEEEGFGGWGNASETGWVNEEYDAICNAALGSLPGTPEYEENHKEAQRIFSQEVPVIPLFLRLKVAGAGTNVKNFGVDPTQNSELYNLFEIDLE